MTTTVLGSTLLGVEAVPVKVEVDLLARLPNVTIVGLPAAAVRETAERVRSAITAAGFDFPRTRIVVNLVPADLRKVGTGLDLPIAVGILVASDQIPAPPPGTVFLGELSLNGDVRPVRGSVAAALMAAKDGGYLVTSPESQLAALGGPAHGLRKLRDVNDLGEHTRIVPPARTSRTDLDLSDILDLDPKALDGLVEAARTGRPLLLVAPPGTGRSMIARRFGGLLGPLSEAEALDVNRTSDAAGLESSFDKIRPFRAPHHTVSVAGLIGDRFARPGEATLADHGVLFLDEFVEFARAGLDVLRVAATDGRIRAASSEAVILPSRFHLVASASPGDSQARLEHPILANAVRVELKRGPFGRWPSTAEIRARVQAG